MQKVSEDYNIGMKITNSLVFRLRHTIMEEAKAQNAKK